MAQHAGNTLENNRRERGEAHAGMGGGKRLVRRVLALLALAAVLLLSLLHILRCRRISLCRSRWVSVHLKTKNR